MMKKAKTLLAGVGLAAALGAGAATPASAVDLTMYYPIAVGGPLTAVVDGMVADFMKSNPDVKVKAIYAGNYDDARVKALAALKSGQPAQTSVLFSIDIYELIEQDAIVAFDDIVTTPEEKAWLGSFYPGLMENGKTKGKTWGIPFQRSTIVMYYNKDLFRAAGLDPDRPPRTWEEYREFARRLTRDDDGDGTPEQHGLAAQITASMFENMLVQNGGSLLNADETAVAFDSPEGVEAMEFLANLLVRDGSALVSQGFEYQNEFLAGNAAMIEGSSVSLAFMEGKYAFEMGIAPLPAGKKDTQLVAGTDVVIFGGTPQREARAWKFVKWFTDTEQTARWSAATGYLPVRRSAMEDPVLAAKLDRYPGLREAFEQLDRAVPQPKAKAWYAGRNILEREAVEPVLRGSLEPAAALAAAAAKASAEFAAP
jgi:sn-glycerol 3-phosphate transport system substrate-binding protein